MALFPIAFLVGTSLGLLRGGSFRTLAAVRVRLPALVGLALMLQVAIAVGGVTTSLRFAVLVTSYGVVGVWLALNLTVGPRWLHVGLACLSLGYALNFLVIVRNGRMPVSMAALSRAGGSRSALQQGVNLDKHLALGAATTWRWLGDVVAIPPLRVVISVGDIAMLVGVVVLLSEGMVAVASRRSDSRPNATGEAVR